MSQPATTTRRIADSDVPPVGTWRIDPAHAEIAFVGRHFMLTKIRGRFGEVDGSIVIADDIADSSVDVTIDVTSLDSGNTARDEHLLSVDLFDVERHPRARFRSTSIQVVGDRATLLGELTIRDVTREVQLDVAYVGSVRDPWGNDRVVFSATGRLDREQWGLTWNMPLDNGGLLVSKEIDIEIELEATRDA